MELEWRLALTAAGLAALAGAVAANALRDLWDAIAATSVFFALFAAAGTGFAQFAEHWLGAWHPITADVARSAVVAATGLVAASLAATLACAVVALARGLAARVRGELG